ncbi:EmrB/QacA subfamily drug resistance transporter [Labrenzia sp. EL_13]|nr:EmrB/QacA subfamily drug resistance transporter [Labrenzia sp. EL_13]
MSKKGSSSQLRISEIARKRLILAATSCLLGLVLLDETAIGVVLPTVQREFGFSETRSHWFINAYLLSLACFVAVSGKLADMYGILRVFLLGLSVFAFSSLLVAVSSSGDVAIVGRALQGLGAAICFPLFVAIITITFPKAQTGAMLGVCATVGTVFMAAGPFVGGLVTEYFSWRGIFLINPPILLVVGLIAKFNFRDLQRPEPAAIDWFGFILLCCGLFSLVFALMQASEMGWNNPTIMLLLGVSGILFVSLIVVEKRVRHPFILVSLFRNGVFSGGNLTMFAAQFAKVPLFVFTALYAQSVLGLDPLAAGSIVMLAVVLQPFAAPICGRLTDRMPAKSLVCFGYLCLILALVFLCLATLSQSFIALIPGLLLSGVAFPFLFIPSQTALMAQLPENLHGQGGGISISSQMIGGTLGLSISSAIFSGANSYQYVFVAVAVSVAIAFGFSLFGFQPVRSRAKL